MSKRPSPAEPMQRSSKNAENGSVSAQTEKKAGSKNPLLSGKLPQNIPKISPGTVLFLNTPGETFYLFTLFDFVNLTIIGRVILAQGKVAEKLTQIHHSAPEEPHRRNNTDEYRDEQ